MKEKKYKKDYEEFLIDIDSIKDAVAEMLDELFSNEKKVKEFVIGFELQKDPSGLPVVVAKRATPIENKTIKADTIAEVEELNGKTIITTLLNVSEINHLSIQTENDKIVKIIVDDKVAKEIRLKKEILPKTLKWAFRNNVLEIWFRQKH